LAAAVPDARETEGKHTMAEQRSARWGLSTYAVRVSQVVAPGGEVYFEADSVTVGPSGALVLSVEVPPIEDEDPEHPSGIENAPYVVLAPGQWYSAVLIEARTRRPYFEWLKDEVEGEDTGEGGDE
jgi:hypothetical protein